MLYLLILGALITIVVAWIFDITPDGVQKTKPTDEVWYNNKSKDPNFAYTHHANAVIAVWTEFDWEKGEKEFLKAIEPDHFFTRYQLWGAYECLGDYEKVFELWKQIN